MSGDLLGCKIGGSGSVTDTYWADSKDAANYSTCGIAPHNKESHSFQCQWCLLMLTAHASQTLAAAVVIVISFLFPVSCILDRLCHYSFSATFTL